MYKLLNIVFFFFFFSTFGQNNEKIIFRMKNLSNSSPILAINFSDSLTQNYKSKNKLFWSKLNYYKADAFENNNNFKKASELLIKTKSEFLELGEKELYIKSLISLSFLDVRLYNYTNASSYAFNALKESKKLNNSDLKARSYGALSYVYFSNKDYEKSIEYIKEVEFIHLENNDSIGLESTYGNIAIIYKNIGFFDEALFYNRKSLAICILLDLPISIGKSYSNIGRVYENIGEIDTAIVYYKKAIANNEKNNISNSIPYTNIAVSYSLNKNYKLSEKFYNKALNIVKINQNIKQENAIYKDLLKISILQQDYKKALFYQEKFDSNNFILVKHENEENLKMLENQHNLFKTKAEIDQIKRINNKNRIIFFIIFIVLVLIGLFLLQRNRNNILKSDKEKLILEQTVLRSQMNPHFIFNSLSAIQNSLLDNDPIKSATYLSRFAKLIRQNFDFINKKTILLSEEIDALKNYLDTQKMRFQDKFDYQINIHNNIDVNIIEIPPLLIQPFVENSIEHGFKNINRIGSIIINIKKENEAIWYEIIDNGKGMSDQIKDSKLHSNDVFKKRLKLRGNGEQNYFSITSSNKGTVIKFCLKQY